MSKKLALCVVVVAVLASGCAFLRPGPGGGPGLVISVGPPLAGGARVVEVRAPSRPAGGAATVRVWVDHPDRATVATGTALPFRFTLDAGAYSRWQHLVYASADVGRGPRLVGLGSFDNALRLNQVQALGTHNSYHVAPTAPPWNGIDQWQYSHDPLPVQFQSQGVRQIELDVYVDAIGHRVLHVPDVDFGTTCATYVACLREVKAWSDAHPHHLPIAILTELNDTDYGFPTPILPWTAAAMDQLDAEIRSVFPPARVLTPDDVRGRHATLAEAIATDGWPTIDSVRGQVLFLMDNGGGYRDTYTAGHPSLEGRMIFTNSDVGRPDAAFIKLNDPVGDAARIRAAVAAGYVVRTRADSDTFEARANNTVPRDAALAGGATWVSTDFEVPGRAYGQPYFVSIPGGTPARCNPINAPAWCTPGLIESLP
jgi:hypothetical protein